MRRAPGELPRRYTSTARIWGLVTGGLLAIPIAVILALAIARYLGPSRPTRSELPAVTPVATRERPASLPASDVPGTDIVGLPRYTDAVRVRFYRLERDSLITTRADYLTPATLETVHNFYRDVFFSQGWAEADVRFTQGQRYFFVVADQREASITLSSSGALTAVTIEVTEPSASLVTTPAPTLTTAPAPPTVATQRPAPATTPQPTPIPATPGTTSPPVTPEPPEPAETPEPVRPAAPAEPIETPEPTEPPKPTEPAEPAEPPESQAPPEAPARTPVRPTAAPGTAPTSTRVPTAPPERTPTSTRVPTAPPERTPTSTRVPTAPPERTPTSTRVPTAPLDAADADGTDGGPATGLPDD